jgi:hypothetical protein
MADPTEGSMSTEERETFDSQGYVLIKEFFGPSHMERLSAIGDRIHAQWVEENRAEYGEGQLVNMHSLTSPGYFDGDPAGRIDFFERLAAPGLTELLDRMFGNEVYFHNTQLFFNPFENKRLPYWHRDLQYSPIDDAAQAREQGNLVSLGQSACSYSSGEGSRTRTHSRDPQALGYRAGKEGAIRAKRTQE